MAISPDQLKSTPNSIVSILESRMDRDIQKTMKGVGCVDIYYGELPSANYFDETMIESITQNLKSRYLAEGWNQVKIEIRATTLYISVSFNMIQ